MGNQYIETLDMYGKKKYFEYPSEWGAEIDRDSREFAHKIAGKVFNEQWGIFYYEPCNIDEARIMIEKFREKIDELELKYVKVEELKEECMNIVENVEKNLEQQENKKKVSVKRVRRKKKKKKK